MQKLLDLYKILPVCCPGMKKQDKLLKKYNKFFSYILKEDNSININNYSVDQLYNKYIIYLNDLKEEDGGATFFYKDTENGVYQDYSVIPKVGRVLLFEDYFNHEGSILYDGLKYCIHTYIMYGSFTKEEDFKEEKINENNKYCIYYTNTSKTEASYIEFTTYCNGEEYIYKRDFRETENQCPNCGSLILCCSESHVITM